MARERIRRDGQRRGGRGRALFPAADLLLLMTVVGTGVYLASRGPPDLSKIPPDPRQKLLGRWLRPDGGYVLIIQSIGKDGSAVARYENPRPIHVASARAEHAAGKASLHVELRDRNYPGNYYTLTYEPGRDQLAGVYHHLGIGQDLEVVFVRLRR